MVEIARKIMEIIPLNHKLINSEHPAKMHLARIREANLKQQSLDFVTFLSFEQDKEEKILNIIHEFLEFLTPVESETVEITLEYPEFIQNIQKLREKLEVKFIGWDVMLNLSTFTHHFHAILIRDGLISNKYNLHPYEIFNPDFDAFKYAIIPQYNNLDLIDWTILGHLTVIKNTPLNLKLFLQDVKIPGWKKTINTYDQKVRNRLKDMVDRGLLDYEVGPNGEKSYYIKVFKI